MGAILRSSNFISNLITCSVNKKCQAVVSKCVLVFRCVLYLSMKAKAMYFVINEDKPFNFRVLGVWT